MSAFANWLEENHPEELGNMTSTELEGNKFSPEFFAIWEQRVPEYVAEGAAGRTAPGTRDKGSPVHAGRAPTYSGRGLAGFAFERV